MVRDEVKLGNIFSLPNILRELMLGINNMSDHRADLVQAQSANFTAMIGLYRAMGGGWIVEEEKTANLPKPKEAVFFP